VIDDVFGKQLGMQERQLAADEVAYSFFSSVREAAGDQMDPETSAELNRLLALSQAEKGERMLVTLWVSLNRALDHPATAAQQHHHPVRLAS
jgi:hypothetical protein